MSDFDPFAQYAEESLRLLNYRLELESANDQYRYRDAVRLQLTQLAGHALAGILANPSWNAASLAISGLDGPTTVKTAALLAVAYAECTMRTISERVNKLDRHANGAPQDATPPQG